MKFRMFTDATSGRKVAVNVDDVAMIEETEKGNTTYIFFEAHFVDSDSEDMPMELSEDFDTVFSRLNTIAE